MKSLFPTPWKATDKAWSRTSVDSYFFINKIDFSKIPPRREAQGWFYAHELCVVYFHTRWKIDLFFTRPPANPPQYHLYTKYQQAFGFSGPKSSPAIVGHCSMILMPFTRRVAKDSSDAKPEKLFWIFCVLRSNCMATIPVAEVQALLPCIVATGTKEWMVRDLVGVTANSGGAM